MTRAHLKSSASDQRFKRARKQPHKRRQGQNSAPPRAATGRSVSSATTREATTFLVGEALRVAAIIDWEFAYIWPTQFALDPPRWLLLKESECWADSIDEWSKQYGCNRWRRLGWGRRKQAGRSIERPVLD